MFSALLTRAQASFEEGVEAYKRGDYKAALDEWLAQAAANDARALFNIGQLYRMGRGVEVDVQKAEQYYRRAAHLGHIGAHGNLGSLYYDKQPPDVENALYYWRLAAKGGDPRAQYLYGIQYFNGDHIPRDYVLAYAWVSLAAKAGLVDAQAALTSMMSYMDADDIAEGDRMASVLLNPDEMDAMRQAELAAREARPTEIPPDPNLVAGDMDTGNRPASKTSAVASVASPPKSDTPPQDNTRDRDDEAAGDLVVQVPTFHPDGPPPVAETELPPPPQPTDTLEDLPAERQSDSSISDMIADTPAEAMDGATDETDYAVGAHAPEAAATVKVPEEKAVQAPAGIYRAQLASLRTEADVRAAWLKLRNAQPVLFEGRAAWVEVADLGSRGAFRRLKVGPYATAEQAQAVCDILVEAGQPCLQTVARQGDILLNTSSAAIATLAAPAAQEDIASVTEVIADDMPAAPTDAQEDMAPLPDISEERGENDTDTGKFSDVADAADLPVVEIPEDPDDRVDPVAVDAAAPAGGTSSATHRVQLASFPDPDGPMARWDRLKKQAPDLLDGLATEVVPVDLGERGTYYRLYVGPLEHPAANDLCAALKQRNIDCLVSRIPTP